MSICWSTAPYGRSRGPGAGKVEFLQEEIMNLNKSNNLPVSSSLCSTGFQEEINEGFRKEQWCKGYLAEQTRYFWEEVVVENAQ
jgi:hypothetical protein